MFNINKQDELETLRLGKNYHFLTGSPEDMRSALRGKKDKLKELNIAVLRRRTGKQITFGSFKRSEFDYYLQKFSPEYKFFSDVAYPRRSL